MMPTRFDALPTATWPRLRNLLDGQAPGGPVINMTIGEPKHKFPDWVGPALVEAMAGFNSYPDNNGTPELREAITGFLRRRYAIDLDMDSQVMVLNGTREGLFNAVVALGQTGIQDIDSKSILSGLYGCGHGDRRAIGVFASAGRKWIFTGFGCIDARRA